MAPPVFTGDVKVLAAGDGLDAGGNPYILQGDVPIDLNVTTGPYVIHAGVTGAALMRTLHATRIEGRTLAPVDAWDDAIPGVVTLPAGTDVSIKGGTAVIIIGEAFSYIGGDVTPPAGAVP